MKHVPIFLLGTLVGVAGCSRDPRPAADLSLEAPPSTTAPALATGPVPGDAGGQTSTEELASAWDAKFAADLPLSSGERAVAEQAIVDAVSKVELVAMVEPVECRATRCKMVIKAADTPKLERAFGSLFGAPGPAMAAKPLLGGPGVVSRRTEGSDGSVTATIYLGRTDKLQL